MGLPAVKFDTLSFAKSLREAGCDERLAEVYAEKQAEVIQMLVDEQLLTKADIKDLEASNKLEMTEIKHQIKDLDNAVKMAVLELKQEIINQGIRFEQEITKQAIKFNQKVKGQGSSLLIKLSVVVSAVIVGTISLLDLMHKFQLI